MGGGDRLIAGDALIIGAKRFDYYEGSYIIDPKTFSQTISVSGRAMSQDLVVNPYEIGSEFGQIIGRNIEIFYDSLEQITEIGPYAFCNCIYLNQASFPVAMSVGSYAFSGCTILRRVLLPRASVINNYAFHGCSYIGELNLPSTTYIGEYAF
jgi:hypothetical protein